MGEEGRRNGGPLIPERPTRVPSQERVEHRVGQQRLREASCCRASSAWLPPKPRVVWCLFSLQSGAAPFTEPKEMTGSNASAGVPRPAVARGVDERRMIQQTCCFLYFPSCVFRGTKPWLSLAVNPRATAMRAPSPPRSRSMVRSARPSSCRRDALTVLSPVGYATQAALPVFEGADRVEAPCA